MTVERKQTYEEVRGYLDAAGEGGLEQLNAITAAFRAGYSAGKSCAKSAAKTDEKSPADAGDVHKTEGSE